ncbi:MAG: hypothetical protein ACLU30_18970 [Odoribacter splanchnicus]
MAKYKLRLAKPSDAKEIANLHYSIREQGAPGIFAMMGKPFERYYKIVLNDPNEVVIVQKTKKARLSVSTVVPWMQKRRWTICGEKGFNWLSLHLLHPFKSEIDQTFIRPI